jgi:hypothetical protein
MGTPWVGVSVRVKMVILEDMENESVGLDQCRWPMVALLVE